jgi:molybdopterin-containing oxidoreductase family molybdopterin binding subunit
MGVVKQERIYEDVWIPTLCGRCYASCGIRVRRVNGVAVKIEGQPESPHGSRGGTCAKGLAGLQVLYDPNRLKVPLRRTNPEKGLFADPQWKEISWDEALDEIAQKLKKVVEKDPKRLLWQGTTVRPSYSMGNMVPILEALGEPIRYQGGGGLHCGQGAHRIAGLVHGSWSVVPDFRHCNYAIYFGANKGGGSGHSAAICIRLAAEARARGMKFVAFDPLRNFASSKATEWFPIIPGTDGAVMLAMCNVIVNELKTYDEKHLKWKTNAPYLAGEDGRYMRDGKTGEPLIWDPIAAKAKAYDDPSIGDFALQGEYEAEGRRCRPVFELVREHIKKYTPEMASQVSDVPAATIRRIATEFAEAASIGSTIVVGRQELPFRPASAVLFRGGEGHENSHHTCAALALLNQIVGSADVPGGTLGWTPVSLGFPLTGKPAMHIGKGKDGMLTVDRFGSTFALKRPGPWPPRTPEFHRDPSLHDIFVFMLHSPFIASSDQQEIWQKIGWDGGIEMMISWGANTIMSVANRDVVAETLKRIPFIVVSELYSTELAEGFADILLPDTCYLEESDWVQGSGLAFNYPFGQDDWAYHILQAVVEPQYGRRNFHDVMWELIDRIGRWDQFMEIINKTYDLADEYKIGPGERITRLDLCDRMVKSIFGPEHDWEWFKRHGFITWPKKVEEAYWRWFTDCRVPIYLEHLIDAGEKTGEITSKLGIDIDISQYTPLISWTPCSIHRVDDTSYDLYCFSYRDILHTGSHTMEQPWLDEVSSINPYTYNIAMNTGTARQKGLKDGDLVELESVAGRKIDGRLKVLTGIHEKTVGIAACSGHWAKGMPVAKGKGANFDILMEIDLKHCDPICLNLETAVRVKVRKIG